MKSISSLSAKRSRSCPGSLRRAVIAAVLILPVFIFTACSGDKKAGQKIAPVPVQVDRLRHVETFQTIPVSGSVVSPYGPSVVSFLVSGRIVKAGPREGEQVGEGQFLASIDPVDYRLAVKAAAEQTEQARVAFARSEDEYKRMRFLFESKSLAPNDFEKFKAACDGARQQLEQALSNEQISRKRLSDTTLSSPVAGFVAKRSVEPGEMTAPGRPVFEIIRLDPVEINVGVPETDVQLVKIGQKASVTIPALAGRTFEGVVRVVNVAADPSTRTYMTRITVPNPEHILRVGMVAEAKIHGNRKIDIMTLPGSAIVRDPQGATMVFVYYPDQQRVYARRVEIGGTYDRDVEIRKGLSGTESIIVAGQDKLRDGVMVSLTSAGGGAGR